MITKIEYTFYANYTKHHLNGNYFYDFDFHIAW